MATTPVVLMTAPMLPDLESALDAKFVLLRLWQADGGGGGHSSYLARNADKIRGLVVNHKVGASRSLVESLPKLEIVSSFTVGLDKIDLEACRQRGIKVTNTPDVLTDETADTALALVLATMRRICSADRYVRKELWPVQGEFPLAYKVSGKRMGIVGLGRIGTAIAKRAEGFNCSISYYSRSKKPVAYKHYDNLVELAKESDILVVACALSEETYHIVDEQVLNALGAQGTLVNIARGQVVDEAEMVKALLEGRLGAAGLDVFENEPYVPQQLLTMENVVLLPHVGSATWETRRTMADLVVKNLEAHFSCKPLITPV